MATAQLRAPLYWPGAEFMYLVFTTSTGEAITVVQKPAPNADVKWQGRSSVKKSSYKYFGHGLILSLQYFFCSLILPVISEDFRSASLMRS